MVLLFIDRPEAFAAGPFHAFGTLFGFALGLFAGIFLAKFIDAFSGEPLLSPRQCPHCGSRCRRWQQFRLLDVVATGARCRNCSQPLGRWGGWIELATALLFGGFVFAYVTLDCQKTDEVRPHEVWWYGRIVFHLLLISLLVAATVTDLQSYSIPDSITVTGMVISLMGATLSGDLQLIHLWVDWNQHVEGLAGPYMPGWLAEHQHWHGLAWSAAGLVAGGFVMWLARGISSFVLGQEALGFGDVMLMAMIGSFVGWQPVIFVFLLAPLCGLVVAAIAKLVFERPFVPYGPYLSVATVIVLFSWKWLWQWEPTNTFSIRRLFGDWMSLVILSGTAVTALAALLGLLRVYRAIPGKRRRGEES